MKVIGLISVWLLISIVAAEDGHKPYERKLSEHEHHDDDGDDEHHDARFDHEAFLGKDESEKFDELSPEESKERLALIVDKIDKDKDGKITEQELRDWVHYIGQKRMNEDAKKQYNELEPEAGKLTWEKYEERFYGKPEDRSSDEKENFKANIGRDEKKWKKADQDGDGALSESEYLAFVHPEEAPHMRDIVIQEALSEIDQNKDGFISLDEYLQDHWKPSKDEPEEPDWLKNERETFARVRDKNKDGQLDVNEVGEWIVPTDYDNSLSEAKHLIQQADADKDGVLTKEEILNKHDLFAGSQATDYGSAINRHEEL